MTIRKGELSKGRCYERDDVSRDEIVDKLSVLLAANPKYFLLLKATQ